MDDFDLLGIENIRAIVCGDVRTRVRDDAELQWRVPGEPGEADKYRVLTGYPAVFNAVTTLYEGKRYVIQEKIAEGFFDDVLSNDCHLNYVHESASAMARNGLQGIGGMTLSVDAHGLRVYAQLPLDDWDVQRIAPKMDRGVVNQMSFAFTPAEEDLHIFTDEQDREVHLYTLKKCRRMFDVCVAPLGAYSQTEAALRSVFAAQLNGRAPIGAGLDASGSRAAKDGAGAGSGERRSNEGARTLLLAEGQAAVFRYRERKEP